MADNILRRADFKRKPVNRKLIAVFFGICGLVSLGFFLKQKVSSKEKVLGWWGPLQVSFMMEQGKLKGDKDTSRPTTKLVSEISQKVEALQGKYAVYVYRLGEEVGYGVNEGEEMPAASIMKVPIMVAAMRKVDSGTLKLDDVYVLRDEDKESGSGPLEFMGAGTKLSAEDLLQNIGQKSDNTATVVLANWVGRDFVEKTVTDLGMKDSSFANNITTARDVAAMWTNLYKGEVISNASRDKLFGFLKDSIYEDRIPAGVPNNVEVIHKVGTGDAVWADAGIVNSNMVLVVLDRDANIDEAGKAVPEITRAIWNFETSRLGEPSPTPIAK